MKTAISAFGIVMLAGATAYAADAPPAASKSALISDSTVRPNDSPLVRAAKMVAANRARMAVHSARVIDNATLQATGGHFTVASSTAAPLPTAASASQQVPADPPPSQPSTVNRAEVQKKIENLKREQARMAEEADSPYGNEVSEDLVDKRMEEIPLQLNQLQNQLKSSPPPSSTTTPPQQ
jgi:hypothetical protein